MVDNILVEILNSDLPAHHNFAHWLTEKLAENESCSLEQFAVFFTTFVRSQTNKFLGTNATTSQNNQKSTKPSLIKNELTFPSLPSADHHVDEAKFTSFESTPKTSKSTSLVVCNSSIKSATNRTNDGLNRTAELIPTHRGQNVVKSLSFDGQLTSPNENHNVPAYSPFSKGHNNYKSTPKSSKMKHKSEKPRTPASFCLGDFINCSPVHRGKASKDPSPNYVKSPANLNISAGQSSTHQEPKKIVRRIVPTPVSPKTTSFTTPVFRSENKIFSVSKEEDLEVNNDLILKERECLKNEISIITKQLEQSSPMPTTNNALKTAMEEASPSKAQVKLDLSKVTQKSILDKIVDIQSTLIDLNLVANILSEFSFLLTLSTSKGKTNSPEPSAWPVADCEQYAIKDKKLSTVLRSLPNCVYFALRVLDKQKHMLALLDVTTLRVVLDNELLDVFCEGLKEFLEDIYNYKLQMEDKKSNKEACFPPTKSKDHFTNVFYSEDNDTRNNFPSENEFNAFRKQRDLFYSILQLWESGHLSPTFDFNRELGSKIRPMLAVEHPINMAHLSKLFISQLLISSRFSHELPPELDVDFLNIDKNKFAKLQQRLIAPSDFSINYQFPGNQVFFRDFIIAAKSVTFNEQLKLALVSELVDRNGSSYETISLTFTMDNENSFNEYVVRPETLETMRILSKFLGFVEAHPYSFDGDINSDIEAKQIELRNLTRPTFDVIEVLKESIEDKKLLITIPWLVQYISMLDHITLRLNYYRDLINLLFEIYINLTIANGFHQYKMRPTNLFTLQCCLGWLFENINVFDDYYKYRQNRGFSSLNILKDSEIPENLEQSKKNNAKLSTNRNLFEAKTKNISGSIRTEILKGSFDPLLESILNTACPFLAELRMSVMRLRSLKSVSRSGRYRYITTKIFKEESPKKEYDSQTKLTEAFLHSQPLSVRRTVEFVTERTTSAVVKDFQMEVLLPAKKQAQKNIKLIKSTKLEHVKDEIVAQYANAHVEVQQQWNGYLHEKISTRVKMALDGLLPHEILPPVKSTCTRIIVERCKAKAENWKLLNLNNMEFYCKDARAEAQKHIEEMSSGKSFQSIVLEIKDLSKPIPSEVFKELQFLLYCTSQRPELVEKDSVSGFCRDLVECINAHNLPASVLMLALQMTIYMLQNLVLNCRNIFAQIPKENFVNIFTCDKVKDFITIDEESDQNRSKDDSKDSDDCKRKVHVFDSLITEIFIRGLGSNHECYECLSELLLLLINSKILRLNYLNDRFLTLFKVDLPKEVLLEISFVLDKIAKEVDKDVKDDEKSQLFVEMLADFVGSVEEF